MTGTSTPPQTILVKGRLLSLQTPLVMCILNLTPDSFYGRSRIQTPADAVAAAEKLLGQGAAILDLGAYSSRPGAEDIPVSEEIDRLLPAIEAIIGQFPEAIISADTFRAKVAEAAVAAGAALVNDISGGGLDGEMFAAVAKMKVPYVLMHMRGTPQTMTKETVYQDILQEMQSYFAERIAALRHLGVHDILLDPGFGFAKTSAQSFELLNKMEAFQVAGLPVLAGFSRKSMIYKTLGITADEALNGTTVLNTIALMKGAKILRVHDVKEAVEAVKLWEKTGMKKDVKS